MISNQILQNTIDGLKGISRVELCVMDVDGKEVARDSLAKDGEYELNGGTNILRIEGGKAFLTEANCPDHLCVNQGKIDQTGETITCLPNRLTVTVYGADDAEVEIIS